MNTLLYIGANIDLTPVLFFKDIKNFIFIDCVPFSNNGNTHRSKLEKVMNQNNFILVDENKIDSYLLFRNAIT